MSEYPEIQVYNKVRRKVFIGRLVPNAGKNNGICIFRHTGEYKGSRFDKIEMHEVFYTKPQPGKQSQWRRQVSDKNYNLIGFPVGTLGSVIECLQIHFTEAFGGDKVAPKSPPGKIGLDSELAKLGLDINSL